SQMRHFEVTVGRVETERHPARHFAAAPNAATPRSRFVGNALRSRILPAARCCRSFQILYLGSLLGSARLAGDGPRDRADKREAESDWEALTIFLAVSNPLRALCTLHSALCTLHSALCILHSAFCILHCALCTVCAQNREHVVAVVLSD